MEFLEVILNSIEIVKNIWVCVGECVNYKKILDENVQTLKKKMEALASREEDINTESRNAKYSGGKQLRKEVETWLKNVQDKISEVKGLEKKASKKRYFLRSRFLRLVEKKTQEVVDLIEEGRFPEGLLIYVHQDQEGVLMTTPLVGQSAKETTLMKIWECLMDDGIVKIGVYGMAGVGKTSIVTHIHNQLLESSSFDHVYWVTVSQESNIHKLQGDIARVMRLDLSYEQDARKRATKLFNELKERKKFVLILDDMWKFFPLEELGIPIGIDAGKLIVTSRLLEVCRGMNCQQNIKVEPLSIEEAWELFMEKFGRETVLDPEVEKLAESIAKECGGLPLAIITTARSMSGVDDVHEWRNALTELKEPSKGLIDMENEVFKPLKFSYDRLNNEKLQQCLLYCALFPEDYVIHRMDLIVCWIAEGLVDEMKTRQEQFDKGHSLLNKLENACLLERTTDLFGEICIKMHDVIRDMALKITGVNHRFMVKAGVQLTELPEENEWSENLERVSLMHNYMKGNLPSISPKSPKLCTLMLQSNRHIREIPNSFFVHMQSLRVLDLSQLGIGSLPNSISNLETLRALLLHDCQNLEYVPSLANLTELRELDLRRTQIKELPHGVEKLVNLKRLDLFHTEIAYAFPEGVLHILSHLQSLGLLMFKITDDVHVEEIISLKQLEVLVVPFYNLYVFNNYVRTQHWLKLNKYNLQVVRSQVMVSDKVRCREVHVIGCSLIQGVEDPLVLPANIQELRITLCNDLHSLLDISSSLKSARELERCLIEFCEGIQNLWSWSISPPKEDSSKWCANTNTNTSLLQSLKTLMVQWLPNLSVLFDGVGGAPPKCGTFSNLNLVSIGECPNLKFVFTRALVQYHLKNLEVIHVYHCSEMENIVLEEEEEIIEEIVAEKEEEEEVGGSNERTITCPKLQWLELEGLPKLKSIWSGAMVCHSLHQIEVRRCPVLKRLPISDLFTLKKISGSQSWWDMLEWDHPNLKSVFQPLFDAKISSNGYSRRAAELWRQDLRRYEK